MNELEAPPEASVYVLADPRTNDIKFVSVASSELRSRLLFKAYLLTAPKLREWLADLKASKLSPKIEFVIQSSLDRAVFGEPVVRRAAARHYELLV